MSQGLVIGTCDMARKEEAVLKALVRLLEGGSNIRARFSEQLQECNVVFVPGPSLQRLPSPCITVRVHDPEQGAVAADCAQDLVVAAPLRMSNVIAVLQSATQRVYGTDVYDAVKGQQALFFLMAEHTRQAELLRAVVPMSSGQQIVFDFTQQQLHTAVPQQVLLSGAYTLGTPHPLSPVEEALIHAVPTHGLRPLVWGLALRLAQAEAATPARPGRYRLLRWPDSAGLATAGHPRLAALWTQRALNLAQIDASSGVPPTVARWFLEACLALGLAVDETPPAALGGDAPAAPAALSAAMSASAPALAPSWFGHLRERLKLW